MFIVLLPPQRGESLFLDRFLGQVLETALWQQGAVSLFLILPQYSKSVVGRTVVAGLSRPKEDNYQTKTRDCDSNNRQPRLLCHAATDWPTSAPGSNGHQPNKHKKKRSPFELLFQYPEPGSNRHRGEPTGVWDQRVYRFRHPGWCDLQGQR